MTNVLLLIPPHISFQGFIKPAFNERTIRKSNGLFGSIVTDVPIGALSLSAYLEKNSAAKVRIVDFNIVLTKLESFTASSFIPVFEETLAGLVAGGFVPSIIGISSLFTTNYRHMIDIGTVARSMFPDCVVVAGGGVPTNMYERIFADCGCFDALCFGEGELPLTRLVQAPDRSAALAADPSWITPAKVAAGASFRHDFIEDLDDIPPFDYRAIDLDAYRPNSIISLFPFAKGKMESAAIMTSRGCPHKCTFCSSHTVHGRKMRYHSLERVHSDIRMLAEDFGVKTIVFQDDHFMANKKRVLAIMDILRSYGLNAFFPNSLALYALDRKVLEAFRSVGIEQLVLSIESGSERVLRHVMRKPLALSVVSRVVAHCKALGIATDASVMIGMPGETREDMDTARKFLKEIGATWYRINVATPLIGSEMYEICRENDYLVEDPLVSNFKTPIVKTEDFDPEFIRDMAYLMNIELNFVENSDLRAGNYQNALSGFLNTLQLKHDHAIAHYFAAVCYRALGNVERYDEHRIAAEEYSAHSPLWQYYFDYFKLKPLPGIPTTA